MWKRALRVLTSKTFALALLAVCQIAFLLVLVYLFASWGIATYVIISIITVVVLVAVLDHDGMNPAYKLAWAMLIMVMPVFGVVFYLMWGHHAMPRSVRRQVQKIDQRTSAAMQQDMRVINTLEGIDQRLHQCAHYLRTQACSPVYPADKTEYYPLGKDFYPRFLDTIKNAKKYIFMEYYIWEEGVMLTEVATILKQKAAEGVDVRIMWDGLGSLFTLPTRFEKEMTAAGIKCCAFSPIRFTARVAHYAMLNHRDHRKITVVDGEIGFSGGLNIADEYINIKERFGEWKDTSFMITGEAVYSLTTIFLRGWDYAYNTETNLADYQPLPAPYDARDLSMGNGFVQPYWDSPLDSENVSENAYMNLIRHAVDYIYISTPYLILDNEMITNLALAAKCGVDVRILTPGIPDKPKVFLVTQSYYPALLREGVRIFEYTPGFNHAKMYVCDDKTAIIGSANMDFRSLFLHFENCVAFYGGDIVRQTKLDMQRSFAAAHEVTLDNIKRLPWYWRLVQIIGRFFAPLL